MGVAAVGGFIASAAISVVQASTNYIRSLEAADKAEKAGEMSASISRANRDLAIKDAALTREEGGRSVSRFREWGGKVVSSQEQVLGAVGVGGESAELIREKTESKIEEDIGTIQRSTERQAERFEATASQFEREAQMAIEQGAALASQYEAQGVSGFFDAGASIMSQATNTYLLTKGPEPPRTKIQRGGKSQLAYQPDYRYGGTLYGGF